MNEIRCSVEEALEILRHLNKETYEVILTVDDTINYVHLKPKRIKVKKGEELIEKAEDIHYQNNDIFGRISLYGVTEKKGVVHNLLFPQLE